MDFEEIEPRLLYSADPIGAQLQVLEAEVRVAEPEQATQRELILLDASVAAQQGELLAQLQTQRLYDENGQLRAFDVRIIASDRDGLSQLSELSGQQQWSAVHLISHGSDGAVYLGNSVLNQASLEARADEVSALSNLFSGKRDFLLYGCDLAQDSVGQAFLGTLAGLTGTDIAANTSATNTLDWDLDFRTGQVESGIALGIQMQQSWLGSLNTFTVTNTNDSGAGSLRTAISNANSNSGNDIIAFNIGGGGAQTINLLSALPAITEQVTLDATTQSGWAGTPLIVLDGNNLSGHGIRLTATADGSTISGLVIRNFNGNGIHIDAGSDNNTVRGNYIGSLNTSGVYQGTGEANAADGIYVGGSYNTIGGLTASTRNVITGNSTFGIEVNDGDYNILIGNYIGLAADGTTAPGNGNDGIQLLGNADYNTIGGASAAARNVIAGNSDGIQLGGGTAGANYNLIQGNFIGTDATGTLARGNSDDGLDIWLASSYNSIIGNVISSNSSHGITVGNTTGDSTGNVIRSNMIGTAINGVAALGNTGNGIEVGNAATANNTSIGGINAGDGNIIAYNTGKGVAVLGGSDVSILGNRIFGNGGLGIDLGTVAGITANDYQDIDSGPNNLQNFPILTSANLTSSGVAMTGYLNSQPGTTYRIEFFANRPGSADPSGFGEGRVYLGYTDVFTDTYGDGSFTATVGFANQGDVISATATQIVSPGVYGSTSEFSMNFTVGGNGHILVVDTTSDASNGTTTSITNLVANRGSDQTISLREAITAANNTSGQDLIVFNIPGLGVQTITVTSALPQIRDSLVINAYSQTGTSLNTATNGSNNATLLIELNGAAAGSAVNGLSIMELADNTTIRGLVINRFQGFGISTSGLSGDRLNNLQILGNYIGTDATGTIAAGYGNKADGIGLYYTTNSAIGTNNFADSNIISGNGTTVGYQGGINVGSSSSGIYIQLNNIGLSANGSTVLGNAQYGILFDNGARDSLIGGEGWLGNNIAGSVTGVEVANNGSSTSGIQIISNRIWNNSGLAIDLGTNGANGVTTNDLLDLDGGPNSLQNYPTITAAYVNGRSGWDAAAYISGSFSGTINTWYLLNFYANTTGDPSGHGEAQIVMGSRWLQADLLGNIDFAVAAGSNESTPALAAGTLISMTITNMTTGETSEMSTNFAAAYGELTVTNSSDTVNGNTTNIASLIASAGGDGISLREAMLAAYNTDIASARANILFNIAGAGAHIIQPTSKLPDLRNGTLINGETQAGYVGTPLIQIDGSLAGSGGIDGLTAQDWSYLFGLSITNFSGDGIQFNGAGGLVATSWIGVGANGTAQGNGGWGINALGTDSLIGSPWGSVFPNVISDNASGGVRFSGTSVITGHVYESYIGTNTTGTAALGTQAYGVKIENGATNIAIGLTTPGYGNLISGNTTAGIRIDGEATDNSQIVGNKIGSNLAGTAVIGNGGDNIWITAGADGTLISDNTIVGATQRGIEIWGASTGTTVLRNSIGTNPTGTLNLGNGWEGIYLGNGAADSSIGSAAMWTGNTIAFNGGDGVRLESTATGIAILGNSIFSNTGLGIDLKVGTQSSIPTTNDALDSDTGANNLQNFPVIDLVSVSAGALTVSGHLNSAPSRTYKIELFQSPSADASGYGEGAQYLASFYVTTDAAGAATFTLVQYGSSALQGYYLSSTATEYVGANVYAGTSEFSLTSAISPNIAPVISNLAGDTANFFEGGAPIVVNTNASAFVSDVDSPNFDGGELRVEVFSSIAVTEDVLGIASQPVGPGAISLTGANNVSYSGTVIGTFSGGGVGVPLVISFNSNATSAAVTALLRSITYVNINQDNPHEYVRRVNFALSDGDGGSNNYDTTVNVYGIDDAPQFGTGTGIVRSIIGNTVEAAASALQSDGKILVAGTVEGGTASDFVVVRYLANGSIDTSFGVNGIATIDLSGANDIATSIGLTADGKIVVGGRAFTGAEFDFALVRLLSDGSLDTTFGTNGKAILPIGTTADSLTDIEVLADGRILATGQVWDSASGNWAFALTRFNANGTLDTSFGVSGKLVHSIGLGADIPWGMTVQPDGKIVVTGVSSTGTNPYDMATVRYTANGSLDTSFGTGGLVLTDMGNNQSDTANSVIVQPDGKILVSGYTYNNAAADQFCVVRYLANGTLDPSFGTGGRQIIALSSGTNEGFALALEPDGKIVISGVVHNYLGLGYNFAILRLSANGALDNSFGTGGFAITPVSFEDSYSYSLLRQPDGRYVSVGIVQGTNGWEIAVVRYLSNGSIDTSFGTNANLLNNNPTFWENNFVIPLDSTVAIRDAELDALNGGLGNYAGASLQIARNGGANPQDVFYFVPANGITQFAQNLNKAGVTIATFDTTSVPGQVTVNFTDAFGQIPTSADVATILSGIGYANSSDAPPATATLNWTFNDGVLGNQGLVSGKSAAGTTTVTIIPANDAPVLDNTGTMLLPTMNEDGGLNTANGISVADLILSAGGDRITDPDGAVAEGIAVISADEANGYWYYTTDNVTWTLMSYRNVSATTPNDNSALLLDATARILFVPKANYNGVSGDLTFRAWDTTTGTNGNWGYGIFATGGTTAFSTATETASLMISAVNDAPVLTYSAGPRSTLEEQSISFSNGGGNSIIVSDIDAGSSAMRLTLNVASGGLTLASLAGISVISGANGSGALVIQGSSASLNAALDGLLYQPASNWVGATNLQLLIEDLGNTGSGGNLQQSLSIALTVTNINDAPSGSDQTRSIAEGSTYSFVMSDFGFIDSSDSPANNFAGIFVTSLPAAGSLTLLGVAVSASQFIGAAQIAAGDLEFTPDANANGVNYATFAFKVQDDGSTSNGGSNTAPASNNFNFTVTAVNTAPYFIANQLVVTEGATVGITSAFINTADLDNSAAQLIITISSLTQGRFEYVSAPGVAITSFTQADVNAGFVQFVHSGSELPPTYDVSVSDGALSAGPFAPVTIFTSQNDAPQISYGAGTVNLLEDGLRVFSVANGNAIVLSDADAGNSVVQLSLSTTQGFLYLGNISGLTIVSGSAGSSSVVLQGSIADMNVALDGGLSYSAGSNWYGTSVITVQIDDLGNSGNGGALVTSTPINVTVTSVNDPPQGSDQTRTILENTSYVFNIGDFGFSDPNDSTANNFSGVIVAGLAGSGGLTLSGTPVSINQFVSAAQIAAGNLVFTPLANTNGASLATGSFKVVDDGGIANGGNDTSVSASNFTVNVTAVNTAPSITTNTLTIIEGATVVLSSANINTQDYDNNSTQLTISVIGVTHGQFELVANTGFAITSFTQADINAGLVQFVHDGSELPPTFAIAVSDGFLSTGPQNAIINYSGVNDAPVISYNAGNVNILEDGSRVFSSSNGNAITVSDTDAGNAVLQLSLSVAQGSLSLASMSGLTLMSGSNGASTMVVRGSLADLNAALEGLTYQAQLNDTGSRLVSVGLDDLGNSGSGAAGLANTSFTVTMAAVNDAPQGTNQSRTMLENSSYSFTATDFGFTDVNDSPTNNFAGITVTTLPSAGSLTLLGVAVSASQFISAAELAAGDLVFTPATNGNGVNYSTFAFQVRDDAGIANGGVADAIASNNFSFTVSAVNTGPSILLNQMAIAEGATLVLGAADIATQDFDNTSAQLTISVSAVTYGQFEFVSNAGVAINSFTQADIDAGLVQFVHDGSEFAPTFSISVSDGILGVGPQAASISFASQNDAPQIAYSAGDVAIVEDSFRVFSVANGNQISLSDPDASNTTVQLTVNTGRGYLSLASLTGLSFVSGGNGSGAMILQGTLNDLNSALDGLTYWPGADLNGATIITLVLNDLGNSGSGGPLIANTMINVVVTPVNDAPSGADQTRTVAESTNYTFLAADFGFTDIVDAPANNFSGITIASLPGAGSLTLLGVAVSVNQFVSLAQISAGDLVFAPVTDANGVNYSSFGFRVRDDGGTSNGGIDSALSSNTFTFDVTAVNNAPTISNNTLSITEGGTVVLSTANISTQDIDNTAAQLIISVSAISNGQFEFVANAGVAITSFSQADIDAGLVQFVHSGAQSAPTFAITVSDGSLSLGPQDAVIMYTPLNSAPTINYAAGPVVMAEDTSKTFSNATGNAITLADPDSASAVVQLTLSSSNGTLTLANLSGIAFSAGANSSNSMVLQGTLASLNAALDGLQFTPTADYNSAAGFTLLLDDLGNSGAGGALSDSLAVPISVTPVNDAPVLLAAASLAPILEDSPPGTGYLVSAMLSGAVSDVDASALQGIAIYAVDNTNGWWEYSTDGSNWMSLSGVSSTGARLLAADATTAIRFTPNSNYQGPSGGLSYAAWDQITGSAGFTADISVRGGTTAFSALSATASISVTSVNDAPQSANQSRTILESSSYQFNTADFVFADPSDSVPNAFAGIFVTSLPVAGSLTLSGAGVSLNQFISAAQIAAGSLAYAPPINANGTAYAGIGFKLMDDGGTINGGVDIALIANTISFDVTPVNTSPLLAANQLAIQEGGTVVLNATHLNAVDVDNTANQLTYTINALSNGRFELVANVGVAITSFTQADIDAGLVQFVHDASETTPSYSVTVSDGGLADGPQAASITFTPVNDAPIFSVPGTTQLLTEDSAFVFSAANGNAITLADSDNGPALLELHLSAANMQLSLSGLAGITFISGANGTSSMVIRGSESNLNLALNGLSLLPAPDFVGNSALSLFISDLGSSGIGGVMTAASTVSLQVAPVNDAPIILLPAAQSVIEDNALVLSLANRIQIQDVDSASGLLSITLTVSSGLLNLAATPTTMAATLTFSGTLADINLALDGLMYTPNANFNGADTLQVLVNDQGGTGAGGPLTAIANLAITVLANNDAPTLNVPGRQQVQEDGSLSFSSGNAIAIADIDAGVSLMRISLRVSNGSLNLSALSGLSFSQGDGVNDGAMTFTGTVSDINLALAGLSYLPTANFYGADRLDVLIEDMGNTGAGGNLTQANAVDIDVLGVNDPIFVRSPSSLSMPEDTIAFIQDATGAFVLSDVDASGQAVRIRISASQGLLSLGSLNGITVLQGDPFGSGMLELSGEILDLNTVLSTLKLTPPADYNGPIQIDLFATDQGGQPNSGPAASAQASLIAQVTAVNDAPVIQLSSTDFTVVQLGVGQAIASGVTVTDVDNATMGWASVSLRAGYQASQDSLYVDTSSVDATTRGLIATQWNNTTGELTLTGTASKSQYAAMLSALRFSTTSTSVGAREVIISVSDGQRSSTATAATGNVHLSVIVSPPDGALPPGGKVDGGNPTTAPGGSAAPEPVTPATPSLPGRTLSEDSNAVDEATAELERRRRSAAISFESDRVRQQLTVGALRYSTRISADSAEANGLFLQGLSLTSAEQLLAQEESERAANALQITRQSGRVVRLSEQEEVRIAEEIAKQSRAMQQAEFDISAAQATTAGAAAFATLLLWTVRAGGLVAAIATSAPAWRNLDPMPLLLEDKSAADKDMWTDDEHSTVALEGTTYMQAAAVLEKA